MNPLLVALDVPSAEAAVRLAKTLRNDVGGFKVGLELMCGPGPGTVRAVADLGLPVFVDVKLHDIPATVRRASERLARLGARWISVHASGGSRMLEAAIEGFGREDDGNGVLAISVLTSLDQATLRQVGVEGSPGRQTSRLARVAAEAGCEGLVCAGTELGVVSEVAPGLVKVTPGVRPAGTAAHDQVRVVTPTEAIARGADLLVVGRPITRAADPVEAARRILQGL